MNIATSNKHSSTITGVAGKGETLDVIPRYLITGRAEFLSLGAQDDAASALHTVEQVGQCVAVALAHEEEAMSGCSSIAKEETEKNATITVHQHNADIRAKSLGVDQIAHVCVSSGTA